MPTNKKTWIIGVVIILLLAAGAVWFTMSHRGQKPSNGTTTDVAQQVKDLGIKDFSVQGLVEKVENSKLYLQTASIEPDGNSNKLVTGELIVDLQSDTMIRDGAANTALTAADLQAGRSVTVYTSDNPMELHEISAQSILINN
jgi:hypothetical protein